MIIAVIATFADCLRVELIDVPDGASEEDITKAATGDLIVENLDSFQRFIIEPSAVEQLKAIKWPDERDVAPFLADAQVYQTAMHQAVVYAAFAKGGPVDVACLQK